MGEWESRGLGGWLCSTLHSRWGRRLVRLSPTLQLLHLLPFPTPIPTHSHAHPLQQQILTNRRTQAEAEAEAEARKEQGARIKSGGASLPRTLLLRTALAEMETLDGSLRKVAESRLGYDANFLGMTKEGAELACQRLRARNVACETLGPS